MKKNKKASIGLKKIKISNLNNIKGGIGLDIDSNSNCSGGGCISNGVWPCIPPLSTLDNDSNCLG